MFISKYIIFRIEDFKVLILNSEIVSKIMDFC